MKENIFKVWWRGAQITFFASFIGFCFEVVYLVLNYILTLIAWNSFQIGTFSVSIDVILLFILTPFFLGIITMPFYIKIKKEGAKQLK